MLSPRRYSERSNRPGPRLKPRADRLLAICWNLRAASFELCAIEWRIAAEPHPSRRDGVLGRQLVTMR